MAVELRVVEDSPIIFKGVSDEGAHQAMVRLANKMIERYRHLPAADYLKAKAEVIEYVQVVHDEAYLWKPTDVPGVEVYCPERKPEE